MITLPPFLRQLPHGTTTPCAGHGDLFVPDHPSPPASVTDEARDLCAACPVRAACADWAISTRQPHGIWGGLTPEERQPPRQRRRPACGTETGWRSHRMLGEDCAICQDAHVERQRAERLVRLEREHREHGGSPTGYRLEVLLGLPTCALCRAARAAYYAGRPRAQRWYRRAA
ncbi:WhiB family transcriptional regulator [Streptomyces cacaoi]|uniref:WhiB family transcriptional regulator n=1 Tax=Streptomyces cacaoi TaxID=1898 RepID=UPI0026380964|nr:WhiB family transcriptional regulator [Streptomyces cacaoi]